MDDKTLAIAAEVQTDNVIEQLAALVPQIAEAPRRQPRGRHDASEQTKPTCRTLRGAKTPLQPAVTRAYG
jgi:hypothetical protein